MSAKTDKYIESAQKLILKGQLDKAVTELEQAVALDPADLKVRQKLAEILVRLHRQSDALAHYETIGKSFSSSGFYLKAIAVYKQIQKIDPDNTKISLTLAELNVSHGLVGNALSEFSLVVNTCLKSGRQAEALQILERMLEIDPANLNTMLKIAETLLATGNTEDAYERYHQLARQLWNRPDKSPFYRLCERIDALFPDRGSAALRFVSDQLQRGETTEAFASLKEIITRSPEHLDAWLLMAETIRIIGDTRQLKAVLEKVCHRFPADIRPKEQSFELALSMKEIDHALELLKEFQPQFIENNRTESLESYYERLRALAPRDERPLEGLCRLFEITGNDRGLNEARERLLNLHLTPDQTEAEADILEPESQPIADETVLDEYPEAVISPQELSCTPEQADWEEEIELELDEAVVAEPAELILPEKTVTFEHAPDLPPVSADFDGFPEECDSSPYEEALTDRVLLTIENPLPVDAFLLLQPVEPVELSHEIRSEEESASPWDEITSDEHFFTDSMDVAKTSLLQASDELMDLLMNHVESIEHDITHENIGSDLPDFQPLEEITVKKHEETADPGENTFEDSFELDEITGFTDALFGGEHHSDAENLESEQYGLGNMLSTFGKDADEQLDSRETESHYNLGIAYKEMGLFDEAIREFNSARHDQRRAADCITLEGICQREKGDLDAAEAAFREGLGLDVLSSEALLNIKYELAQLLEQANRPREAIELYKEITCSTPSYRDASHRLSRLSGDSDVKPGA